MRVSNDNGESFGPLLILGGNGTIGNSGAAASGADDTEGE